MLATVCNALIAEYIAIDTYSTSALILFSLPSDKHTAPEFSDQLITNLNATTDLAITTQAMRPLNHLTPDSKECIHSPMLATVGNAHTSKEPAIDTYSTSALILYYSRCLPCKNTAPKFSNKLKANLAAHF
ncbi:hypothetical protein ANAPC1_00472 [Anaplasma phagocytophilum]|uniref:Uncharacterized protein n=1 Tax=Anaplasma phagocytophilum TaxID=948 RepID=A0AA45ZHE3_ANAPH|nr:hypothetical protein ANAPC1_00472 [Anaplasma phagocytophilum]